MIQETNIIIPNHHRDLTATFVQPPKNQLTRAAILLLHGWASQRHEVGEIYAHLAKQLAGQGIASLRVDFFGCGESSPDHLVDLTVRGMLQDAKIALHYLQQRIDVAIGLCGFSMGAAVMALLMNDYRFTSVVGLSPVVNLMRDLGYKHQEFIHQMLAKPLNDQQPIEYDLGWRKILVRPEFVQQFAELDKTITTSWHAYHGACMVMGGELDFSGDNVKQFSHLVPNAKKLRQEYLPQTDHIFNVMNQSNNQAPWVINTVTDWFVETLVV